MLLAGIQAEDLRGDSACLLVRQVIGSERPDLLPGGSAVPIGIDSGEHGRQTVAFTKRARHTAQSCVGPEQRKRCRPQIRATGVTDSVVDQLAAKADCRR